MSAALPQQPSGDLLFERAACGLLLADASGLILRINDIACRWLGYNAIDLTLKCRVQDLFTMGGRVFHQTHCVPLLQMQGSVSEIQIDLIHHDKTRVPMLVNIVRMNCENVLFDQFALFAASDRHSYEKELLMARKTAETSLEAQKSAEAKLQDINRRLSLADRRKDEFLAMLAHELRNPLAPISASAQLLKRINIDEPLVQQAGNIITRQVGHMTRLINDLLDVARVNSGMVVLDKSSLTIQEVVADAVEQIRPFIDRRRHRFTACIEQDLPAICGDHKRLVQVVANLLQNATKFTPENGIISLNVTQSSDDIIVTIRDNGMGIEAELLPYVFDLFTQEERSTDRAHGGLGLGLTLVKSLTVLHGGQISVSSDGVGNGALFTLNLPKMVAGSF